VQPVPNLDEETSLVSEWHLAPLGIVKFPQGLKTSLDIPRTLLALHDMSVDYVQRFACVSHGLDGAGEESAGADTVFSVAVTTRKSGETHLEAAAAAEAVGLSENAGP